MNIVQPPLFSADCERPEDDRSDKCTICLCGFEEDEHVRYVCLLRSVGMLLSRCVHLYSTSPVDTYIHARIRIAPIKATVSKCLGLKSH